MQKSQQTVLSKEVISQELTELYRQVNELALRLSVCNTAEVNYIWNNLANARAYLSTALEATHNLKNGRLEELQADWTI